jgi:acetylornithine/N-succinyldiaminopimelate aminotransferase
MSVANAVLDVVLADGFLDQVQATAGRLRQKLAELKDRHPAVVAEIRGEGLLIGIRTHVPNTEVVAAMREEHMLAPTASDNVVRLLPPLNIGEEEIQAAFTKLDAAFTRIENGLRADAVKGAAA